MKQGRLLFRWSKRENDFLCNYPSGRADSNLLMNRLLYGAYDYQRNIMTSLTEELEARGYDLTTLRFQIDKKAKEAKPDDK